MVVRDERILNIAVHVIEFLHTFQGLLHGLGSAHLLLIELLLGAHPLFHPRIFSVLVYFLPGKHEITQPRHLDIILLQSCFLQLFLQLLPLLFLNPLLPFPPFL